MRAHALSGSRARLRARQQVRPLLPTADEVELNQLLLFSADFVAEVGCREPRSMIYRVTGDAAQDHALLSQSLPGIERCLLASATIKLASTAKPSPRTRPAAIHVSTTRSNASENIAVAEALVASARERRVIGRSRDSMAPARRAPRTGPARQRSRGRGDRPEPPHRGRTNRTADPGLGCAVPSSLAPADGGLNFLSCDVRFGRWAQMPNHALRAR